MKTRRTSRKPKKRLGKVIRRILLALCIIITASICVVGFKTFNQIKDYDLANLELTTGSSIIDAKGRSIYTYGGVNTQYCEYKDIPEVMVDAIVAAEDARFFRHNGFDLPRIIKAFLSNLLAGHITSGGSTITQQLVKKTFYPEAEQTIQRKLGEIILSIEATNKTSKQKVLELYLNKIYFGAGTNTIGLYAASHYYFNKKPKDLTLPEAAMLAGTVNSPVSYDPFYHLDLAEKRRNIVLTLMRSHGYISQKSEEAAKSIPVSHMLDTNPLKATSGYASYIDRVRQEVVEKTGYDPHTTNMTIYTYMDRKLQKTLDNISKEKSYTFTDPDMQAGAVVQQAKNGRIVGILAAKDYQIGNTDYAYTERHQPGSSIKPIVDYAAAFEYLNWSTGQYVSDDKLTIDGWTPKNWDGGTHGNVSLYQALGNSWNLAAVRTLKTVVDEVGDKQVVKFLTKNGFNMKDQTFSLAYAIGGWSQGVTPEEMAAAYATISNGGTYVEPHTIKKVVINTTGRVINVDKDCQKNAVQAMSDSTAFLLRHVMTDVVKSYSSYSSLNIGDKIGAKTGTSNHDGAISGIPAGANKDIWMCAFSPDYAWACWNGYPGSVQTKKGKYITSGHYDSHTISAKIANYLHSYDLKNKYETPDSVVKKQMIIGSDPYAAPTSQTPQSSIVTEWFVKGHEPKNRGNVQTDIETLSLNGFSASISSGRIAVTFTPGSSTSNVEYIVKIYNGSTLLGTDSFSSQSGTLSYVPEEGVTYTLDGYMQSTDGSQKSNTLSTTVTMEAEEDPVGTATFSVSSDAGGISQGASINSSSITVTTSGPTGHKITITVNGSSKTVKAGHSATFSVSEGSYTVSCSESNGTDTYDMGSVSFTVTADNTTDTTNEDLPTDE